MYKVKINGLEAVINSFGKDAKVIRKRTEQIVTTNALEGRNNAVKLAPIRFGKLRQGIAVEKIDALNQSVVSQMLYSPYVEFGTGGLVEVPSEWKELAMEFKGKGIRVVNIEPQPFMYPSWQMVKKQFSKDMIKMVNESK